MANSNETVDFKSHKYKNSFSRKQKMLRLLWEFVWLLLFRTNPRWLLNNWRIFLLKLFGAKIGVGCKVNPSCKIWAPWNLEMGSYSALGQDVDCYSMDKIHIGSKVTISQRTFLCTGSHDISMFSLPLKTKPIYVADFVWVCAEAFIGPGVVLNEGAVIAAKSVVNNDIESYSVVSGNPAKKIKDRNVSSNK